MDSSFDVLAYFNTNFFGECAHKIEETNNTIIIRTAFFISVILECFILKPEKYKVWDHTE